MLQDVDSLVTMLSMRFGACRRGGAHRAGWWYGTKSFRLFLHPFMPKLPHAKCGLLPSIGTSRIRTAAQSGSNWARNAAESSLDVMRIHPPAFLGRSRSTEPCST